MIINKLKIIPKIVGVLLSHFRYGIFLRLTIQSYFDLLLASYVGINYGNFSEFIQIFNFVICTILIVIAIKGLLAFVTFGSIYIINRSVQITDQESLRLHKEKYAVFFDEFKEVSRGTYLFYLIFMIRRLIIVLMIIFKINQFLQLIVSAIMALSVI